MQRQWEKEKETLDQAKKTKLDSVDERIQSALTSFCFELSTTLAAHVQEMKTELQGMIVIQQTHVIKVALAALTSASSPYVTNDQLQTQFSQFMDGLNQRLSNFERSSPTSLDRKRAKNDEETTMDTDPAAVTPAPAGMDKTQHSELT
jgi:hypothetical protein